MSKYINNDDLVKYFNVSKRTIQYYTNHLGFNYRKLYNKFNKLNSLRDRKTYLYSLKDKFDEDMLDFVWEQYVEQYWHEEEMRRWKTNKRVNRELT